MTVDLTVRRDHLAHHRRMIIGRSIAAAVVGAIPIPVLDSRLSYVVQRSILRKLAQDNQVDLDEDAAEWLVFGPEKPPNWLKMAGSTLALRVLSRAWRKVLITYFTAQRAQAAGRYFLRATMFDHYCAKLHVGLGIDRETAVALRQAMDEALDRTSGNLGTRLFRRALKAAARATARAPVELLDIASRGTLRKLLSSRSDDVATAEEIDTQLDRQLQSEKGFLARAATAVELQLSVERNPYVDRVVDNFERIWKERLGVDVGPLAPSDSPAGASAPHVEPEPGGPGMEPEPEPAS